jgi:hypothetical protein
MLIFVPSYWLSPVCSVWTVASLVGSKTWPRKVTPRLDGGYILATGTIFSDGLVTETMVFCCARVTAEMEQKPRHRDRLVPALVLALALSLHAKYSHGKPLSFLSHVEPWSW